jgi:hypothetical protein
MDNQFDIPKLLNHRKITNRISSYLEGELKFYTTILTPLFQPRLIFGEYINGVKQTVKGSDTSFKQLQNIYKSLQQNKLYYNRLDELKSPMDVFGTQIEFKPFEYNYTATSNGENKTIRIISPLKWVLGYKNQDISQLRELITDKNNSRNSDIRVCILHHLVMHTLFSQRNDIKKLFNALRFQIYSEPLDEFGKIPFVFISCPVNTIRPEDEIIIQSTELSGAPIFEEVVNIDDIDQLSDPYKEQLTNLINNT